MVVASQQQHAAILCRTGKIGMTQHITGPVDTRPLCVPHGKHTIDGGITMQSDLLAAPDCSRRQILIHPGLKPDVMLGEEFLGAPQFLIQRTERGTAIACNERTGIQSRCFVPAFLHHRQANQRLCSVQINPSGLKDIFVFQRYLRQSHIQPSRQNAIVLLGKQY